MRYGGRPVRSNEDRRRVVELAVAGKTRQQIVKEPGVPAGTVAYIVRDWRKENRVLSLAQPPGTG